MSSSSDESGDEIDPDEIDDDELMNYSMSLKDVNSSCNNNKEIAKIEGNKVL